MKISCLFPGQGSQYVGMGKQFYDTNPVVKQIFEEASDCLHIDMANLCFHGEKEQLKQTSITQPAVLTVGVAIATMLEKQGIEFQYGAGHSLGEYTALTAAQAIPFQDAVKLVQLRGQYMQEADALGCGVMSVINGLEVEAVEEICAELQIENKQVEISNYNSPYQTVISGAEDAVKLAEEECEEKKAKVIRLNVSAPFHCSLMKSAAEKLKPHLEKISLKQPKYPIISNVTGMPYFDVEHIRESLIAQMTRAVEWRKSMDFLYLNDVDLAIDVGPGAVTKGLMLHNHTGMRALSVDKDWDEIQALCK